MTVALRNGVLTIDGLTLGGCPCEVITADLNVIVGKLTELVVIHAQKLSLLGSTELETWDLVDGEREQCADGERVGGDSDDVGDLLVDSRGLASDGTSGKSVVDTVKTDNVIGTEDAVEEETPHSSDAVLSEHIEGIVDLDPKLD